MRILSFLLVGMLFFSAGCNLKEREQAVQQKEERLKQKEQELLAKEQELQIKEEELSKKQQHIDSTYHRDTAAVYNANALGTWTAKMVCTETTCAGSAVGDTKTEQWNITYENNGILAVASVNNKIVRVYTGTATENSIHLEEKQSPEQESGTRMVVRLNVLSATEMEGQREIIREADCRILYSLKLNRQQ